jgi:hypothetical protein
MSAPAMSAPADPLHDLWVEASEEVTRRVSAGGRPGVKELLMPLMLQVASSSCLKADSAGFWEDGTARLWLPRFVFQRTQVAKHRFKIGIFAGIHGDEPAGILGLMDFVRELDDHPELGKEFLIHLYPLCNPSGYLAGTRESSSGKDLNREFWRGSPEPEVRILESEIQRKACINTAGPRYLSLFHQYEGHDVEQHAHKIHSYMPSNFLRSISVWRCSFSGAPSFLCRYGLMDLYCL